MDFKIRTLNPWRPELAENWDTMSLKYKQKWKNTVLPFFEIEKEYTSAIL